MPLSFELSPHPCYLANLSSPFKNLGSIWSYVGQLDPLACGREGGAHSVFSGVYKEVKVPKRTLMLFRVNKHFFLSTTLNSGNFAVTMDFPVVDSAGIWANSCKDCTECTVRAVVNQLQGQQSWYPRPSVVVSGFVVKNWNISYKLLRTSAHPAMLMVGLVCRDNATLIVPWDSA